MFVYTMSFLSRYADLGERFSPQEVTIKQALRINPLKGKEQETVQLLKGRGVQLERIPHVPLGYWYTADFSLGATPAYLQGRYYLQESASQLPALVMDPAPKDVILDMAAAPGSKTTQIAQLMQNDGVVVALDNDAIRLGSLRNNLERMGVSCVVCYKKDARFAADLGMTFDKILLDAPCSGNFCIEKNYFAEKSLEGIKQRARLQKELLKAAYKVLNPGGTLVYSTCSLEPEEDELMVDWFIKKYEDISLVDTGLQLGNPGLTSVFEHDVDSSLKLCRRLWPHKTGTQGFFIAKLVKKHD